MHTKEYFPDPASASDGWAGPEKGLKAQTSLAWPGPEKPKPSQA